MMPFNRHSLRLRAWDWLVEPFRTVYRHRRLLLRTGRVELRSLYAGSLLGLLWVLLGPILLLSLYAAIYVFIFRIRPAELTQAAYVLYIFSGLVPFMAFSSSLMAGATSLSLNKQVLLNTVFPAELVPLRAVLVNSVSIVSGLLVVCAVDALLDKVAAWTLLLPVIIILQIMFVTGIAWILSLANLVVRDIQPLLTFVTLALLIATPIAYTPDMIPSTLAPLIWCNPLAYFVMSFQYVLVLNTMPPFQIAAAALVAAVTSFAFGHWVFQRAKQVMFDYA
jgi:lipopolysaccharide transport system permease protein